MTDPSSTPSNPQPNSTPPAATPAPAYSSGAPAAGARYNTLSIVGFILAFLVSLAGLIVSIIAFNQIKTTGEQGRGLAIAGIIISIVGLVFGIIYLIVAISLIGAGVSSSGY